MNGTTVPIRSGKRWLTVPIVTQFLCSNQYLCQASLPGCPVQSVVLLSEAKASPLYCIRSSWLGWYIKHIGILLVWCGTHICQCQSSNRMNSHCLRKTWRIAILWAWKARWSPRIKGKKRAISGPFAIAIRAARLYTAWLRYRSYVMVGLKSSIPTIQECLLSSARSFARSKQDEVALLRRQGSFLTYELV